MEKIRKTLTGEQRELLHCYRRKLAEAFERGEKINRREIVRKALAVGAKHYYLSFEYAYQMLSRFHNHPLNVKKSARHRMWKGLMEQLNEEMEKNGSLTMNEALSRVLVFCKPVCFSMNESYAYKLIYQLQDADKRNSRHAA